MEGKDNTHKPEDKDKDRIILGIESRIKSEFAKHGSSIEDWAKIAAHKIYATYDVKLKETDTL
jgi:hypothetical protein